MPMMWELFNEPFDIRPDGTVHAPDRSGLSFTLRADAIEKFRYVYGPELNSDIEEDDDRPDWPRPRPPYCRRWACARRFSRN